VASKVVVVSTPDVVALRGVRRLRDLWRRLQVREDDQDTLVLLNQTSRKREVQPDLARKVVGGKLAETTIPADFAAFEAAVNTGSPARLEDQKLRQTFEALATELEALPAVDEPAEPEGESRGLLARLSGERGQTTVEFAGILPLLLIVVMLLWQIGLVGYTFMLAGHAAREGARELAIDTTDTVKDRPYADTALEDLPTAWKKGARVDRANHQTVRVKLEVPLLFPAVHTRWKVTSEAGTVIEDEPLPADQKDGVL
jgi:pilus assembly protein CpaE